MTLLLLGLPAVYGAEPRPGFVVLPDNAVGIVLPAAVLDSQSTRRQLSSGLTTTFLVTVRGPDVKGAGRVEIRYNLWDDVWLVRKVEFDRRAETQRLTTRAALDQWWRTPLRIFPKSRDRTSLDVNLVVLPFSADEEEDARSWLSKSGGAGPQSGGSNGLVDVLIGTTMVAKPLMTYRWRIDLSLK